MERKLKALFEYQRFEGNAALARLIAETEERAADALSDEDLFLVNAAGEFADNGIHGNGPRKGGISPEDGYIP